MCGLFARVIAPKRIVLRAHVSSVETDFALLSICLSRLLARLCMCMCFCACVCVCMCLDGLASSSMTLLYRGRLSCLQFQILFEVWSLLPYVPAAQYLRAPSAPTRGWCARIGRDSLRAHVCTNLATVYTGMPTTDRHICCCVCVCSRVFSPSSQRTPTTSSCAARSPSPARTLTASPGNCLRRTSACGLSRLHAFVRNALAVLRSVGPQ